MATIVLFLIGYDIDRRKLLNKTKGSTVCGEIKHQIAKVRLALDS